uniref:CARD domain-containing protein n=1 Tax=Sander lucioperca TaxID=283035 RepID=A0A8D0D3N3_SANLU
MTQQSDPPEKLAEEKLLRVRRPFVERVSDPVLNQILDKLLEHGVITDEEMQSARTRGRADKARDVMDTVRRKGRAASSVLISTLCEVDPVLSREVTSFNVVLCPILNKAVFNLKSDSS